jgi:alkanesulfonate monooxygenase SsuD/methylene tetrahydromethanopterin reductase-like flavin-dependent oxidoreductase (luciferase family)
MAGMDGVVVAAVARALAEAMAAVAEAMVAAMVAAGAMAEATDTIKFASTAPPAAFAAILRLRQNPKV